MGLSASKWGSHWYCCPLSYCSTPGTAHTARTLTWTRWRSKQALTQLQYNGRWDYPLERYFHCYEVNPVRLTCARHLWVCLNEGKTPSFLRIHLLPRHCLPSSAHHPPISTQWEQPQSLPAETAASHTTEAQFRASGCYHKVNSSVWVVVCYVNYGRKRR